MVFLLFKKKKGGGFFLFFKSGLGLELVQLVLAAPMQQNFHITSFRNEKGNEIGFSLQKLSQGSFRTEAEDKNAALADGMEGEMPHAWGNTEAPSP